MWTKKKKAKKQRPKQTQFSRGDLVRYFNGGIYRILNTGTLYSLCMPLVQSNYDTDFQRIVIRNNHLTAYETTTL